nr:TPA: ATPase F0 subunit 6 [Triannulata magna]
MMPDIFSSFDYYEHNNPMFVLSVIMILMLTSSMMQNYNMLSTKHESNMAKIMANYYTMKSNLPTKNIFSYNMIIMYVLMLMTVMNISGLMPYYFSWTSQMLFTVTMALPCWLSMIMSSLMYKPKEFMAHLLPDGAPMWLNPALVIFESISVMVRPLTLSFRLAANMSAGHIVLILMTSFLTPLMFKLSFTTISLFMFSSFFMIFEMAICLIQAFIFFLLLSMYVNDHS